MRKILTLALISIITVSISPAFAHTTVEVGPYEVEVGWGTEPPIVGFRNTIVFEITEGSEGDVQTGIIGAFKNLEATAKFGGITKQLEINSDPRPGHYFSNIIPTRTGTITIELKGTINDEPVDVSIDVEDVESTAVLDFPPTAGSSSDQDVAALKNAMTSLQQDVIDIKSQIEGVSPNSGDFDAETAYNFGVFGLSLGAAGVILAIIAMIKRK